MRRNFTPSALPAGLADSVTLAAFSVGREIRLDKIAHGLIIWLVILILCFSQTAPPATRRY